MTASYNGFRAGDPAIFDPPGLDNRPIPGTDVHLMPGLRGGAIADVLFYVAGQLHARVAPAVQEQGFWGYAFRPSKNDPDLISCHASGTAFDYAAALHPNGKRKTWTAEQVVEIRKILAEVDGLVYWGGDAWGNGTPDEMHFEITTGTTLEKLAEVAAKIKGGIKPAPKPAPLPPQSPRYRGELGTRVLRNGCQGSDVSALQAILRRRYSLYAKNLDVDGDFGDHTEAVVREFQRRSKLTVDGIVGRKTYRALGI